MNFLTPFRVGLAVGCLLLGGVSPALAGGATTQSPTEHSPPNQPKARNFLPNLTEIVNPAAKVLTLRELGVDLKFDLPGNHAINVEAPGRVAIRSPLVGDALIAEGPLDTSTLALTLHWGETTPVATEADIVIEAVVYYCEESKKSVCKIRSVRVFQPVRVDEEHGAARLVVNAPVRDGQ